MGKQSRRKHERRQAKQQSPNVLISAMTQAIFADKFGELQPITDQVVQQLVNDGWDPQGIELYRGMGFLYCRKRNSFVSPPIAE